MSDGTRRRRRWYTYRLAGLLLMMTVIAVLLAGLANFLAWRRAQLAEIDGVWEVVSANGDEEVRGELNFRIEGRELIVLDYKGQELVRRTFTVDIYKSPPAMDVKDENGGVYECIYDRSGDVLTICMPTTLGVPRPGSFDDSRIKTTGNVGLMVFRRVDKNPMPVKK
jgi:uncharacterized protein (TIGR03067 family)